VLYTLATTFGVYQGQGRQHDLSCDSDAFVADAHKYSSTQLMYERVITKTFAHYSIPLEIAPTIRTIFKSKMCRMGKQWAMAGTKKRLQQLSKWQENKY